MKSFGTLILLAVICIICVKAANFFKEQEDADIKADFISVLVEHGGTPELVGYPPREDGTVDSLLIYHTRIEISKEELRALNYLSRYYDIKLQTE